MKVLILNWRDIRNPRGGGAEKVTHDHAKAWVRVGHAVTQFSASFPGALAKETVDGVKIVRRGNHYTVHFWAALFFVSGRLGKIDLIIDEFHFVPFFAPLYAWRVKKLAFIHEVAKDVWFSNLPFLLALTGYLLEPFFFWFYRKVPFMTVSPSTKEDLTKFGISGKNITVVFDGIDCLPLKRVPRKEKEPTVCFVGYLSKDKGIKDALAAFGEVAVGLPQAQFWVVGKGRAKLVRQLEERARSLGLAERVKFFGFVSDKKKLDLMKRAHVLINPSQREGWGLVVIEADAMGTPVVGYNVPGLRDSIRDKRTGILTAQNTPEAMAQEVVKLLKDKKLYQTLQKNALLWAKKFTWEKATKESLKLIEKLVEA